MVVKRRYIRPIKPKHTVYSLPALSPQELLSQAGWAPKLSLPDTVAPPFFRELKRPKQMSGTWRATKTHLLSSFNFMLEPIKVREKHDGPVIWRTRDWKALDENGCRKDQHSLLSKLCRAERRVETEVEEKRSGTVDDGDDKNSNKSESENGYFQGKRNHMMTEHDTILTGTMNDGTSISIHIQDFCPWSVFKFATKEYGRAKIEHLVNTFVKNSCPELYNMSFRIEARAPSDGILPSKRNPYKEKKIFFIYVDNRDASYGSDKALIEAMGKIGAVKVEDDALSKEIRLMQLTQICPTKWYTIDSWEECSSFNTITQIEISCKLQNIIPMEDEPVGVVLAPQTNVFFDTEQHKSNEGSVDGSSKKGLPDPDDIKNNLICINVAVTRTGNFESITPDDVCRVNLPRLDDHPVDMSQYVNVGEETVELPDPLAVEQSRTKNPSDLLHTDEDLLPDIADIGLGDNEEVDSGDEVEKIFGFDELGDEIEKISKLASVDDKKREEDLRMQEDFEDVVTEKKEEFSGNVNGEIEKIAKLTSFGNMREEDLMAMDNLEALIEKRETESSDAKNGDKGKIYMEDGLDNSDKSFKMDVDLLTSLAKEQTVVLPETTEQKSNRHGYEIPSWAIDKLKARINLEEYNATLKDEKKRVATPQTLNNCKYIRRISFFVDPDLPCLSKKFLLKPLYCDSSDGILVHAFKQEADVLLAFRDFLIEVQPNMTCGHFSRSFDWKLIFTRSNCVFNDQIPMKNISRDTPVKKEKLLKNLPCLEFGDMLSAKSDPFPEEKAESYYTAISNVMNNFQSTSFSDSGTRNDAKRRKINGKELLKKENRTSAFAFMDRFLFNPVHLTRRIIHSNNNGTVDSVYPTFSTSDDVDSLISIRLSNSRLDSYKLNFLSEKYLNDAKMDIGIPRMDACYRQKQYWAIIAYCDYDCILVVALMTALCLRLAHAALCRCSNLNMDAIVNFGQQQRIYTKNAVVAHNSGMVLIKCSVVCPWIFGGGHVGIPNGGIYPVCCNCLDFSSYYVSLIMMFNLCFTAYMRMIDSNFDQAVFDPKDPRSILKTYRKSQENLRKVYGPPDRRIRPGNMRYYVCKLCGAEDFSRIPAHTQFQDLQKLPSHDDLESNPSLRNTYVELTPDQCSVCKSKPWLTSLEDFFKNNLVQDMTVAHDPYREQRYAADFDYLVPRSSMVTLQSDPESLHVHEIKRYKPGTDEKVFVREDLLTEHEEFDWIDIDTWVEIRMRKCKPAFEQELKDKKSKGKSRAEMANVPYIPSNASFVLWRPGDFDNQARFLYEKTHDISDDDFVDVAEQKMMEEVGQDIFDVETFKEYADHTFHVADQKRFEAFKSRAIFDRSVYDIRHRRGIVKLGSNTGNVEALYLDRQSVRDQQSKIKKNASYWDSVALKWIDMAKKTEFNALEQVQLGDKSSANSYFGAAGAQSGRIKNTFVAAAITFFSRNYIYYVSYTALTRWCPDFDPENPNLKPEDKDIYGRALKFRQESVENASRYKGLMKKYYKRYVKNAPFPLKKEAGRQVWLEPICTIYQFKHAPIESLWGFFNIYGDTDSIFVMCPGLLLGNPFDPLFIMDEPRRKLGIDIGKSTSRFVTGHFRMFGLKWMTIDWEKMLWPVNLFDDVKKRYLVGHWTKAFAREYITVRSWGIKRDMPIFQQKLTAMIKETLIETISGEKLDELMCKYFASLAETGGRIEDLERDVVRFSKSQAYNKAVYASKVCHVEANNRLARAYPGYEHALGDRIPYVICYDPKQPEITSRSYTVAHIKLMIEEDEMLQKTKNVRLKELVSLRIDVPYYIRQCLATVEDVYKITKPQIQIYKKPTIHANEQSALVNALKKGIAKNILLPGSSDEDLRKSCFADTAEELCRQQQAFFSGKSVENSMVVDDSTTRAPISTRSSNLMNILIDGRKSSESKQKKKKIKSAQAGRMVERYALEAERMLKKSLECSGVHVTERLISSFCVKTTSEEIEAKLVRENLRQEMVVAAATAASSSSSSTTEKKHENKIMATMTSKFGSGDKKLLLSPATKKKPVTPPSSTKYGTKSIDFYFKK